MEPLWTFIDDHTETPFFIWFAPSIPHYPHNPPNEYHDLYALEDLSEPHRSYLASVSWFDAAVGELVEHLESRRLLERTLIVYLTDNGWDGASARVFDDGPRGKASLYENGFRTPVVFHWPGVVAAGRSTDALISTVDLYPTLLDYAGAPKSVARSGRNLRPIVEGRKEHVRAFVVGHLDRAYEHMRDEGGFFVRTPEWYFISRATSPPELYDVVADPEQMRNVAEDHPDVAEDLRQKIRVWRKQVKRVPRGWRPEQAYEHGRTNEGSGDLRKRGQDFVALQQVAPAAGDSRFTLRSGPTSEYGR